VSRLVRLSFVVSIAALATLGAGTASAAPILRSAVPASPAADLKAAYPKADWSVAAVVDSARSAGVTAALRVASTDGLAVSAGGVRVIVQASDVAAAKTAIAATGATIEGTAGGLIQVVATPDEIAGFMPASSITYIRQPMSQVPQAVVDEGVASTNASSLQANGWTGAGTKVAVVDVGFAGLAEAQADGDLPADLTEIDNCDGNQNTYVHGTAVAEIVHKMAPDAQLYLYCEDTEVQLAEAETYVKAHGIKIVNHSVAWFNTTRGDGTGAAGTPDATVADAAANGILWANAAGNYATQHWSGPYVNSGGYAVFSGSDTQESFYMASGGNNSIYLRWDDWPTSDQDFDLELYRESDNMLMASSTNPQTGSQPPTEEIVNFHNTGAAGNFYVKIKRNGTATTSRFDLYMTNAEPMYTTAVSSITDPSSSPHVFAIGAVCWDGTTIEPYSSQGPTIDGRVKPDMSGPDQTSTYTEGPFSGCSGTGFAGTSGSSPHVAGAAALLEQEHPTWTASDVETYLEANAIDLGDPGTDDLYGAGNLHLPSVPGKPTAVVAQSGGNGSALVSWTAPANTGGEVITGYSVTSSPGGKTCDWSSGLHQCTVTGLTNGQTYTFTVTATNSTGTGAPSDPSNSIVPAAADAPGAPTGVTAVAGSVSATVSWSAPASDGGAPIESYMVTSSSGAHTCTWTSGPLSCTVSGLTAGQSYTFTVSATNGAGTGPASAASNSVTPYQSSTYHPITPVRLLDTRHDNGHSGKLVAGTPVTFQVTGRGGVPASATAVTGNLTVTDASFGWAVYLGPSPTSHPGSSTINFAAGQTIANGLTVALSGSGQLSATFLSKSGATTDLVFDVTGYYAPDTSGQTYHPIAPVRQVDTRIDKGLSAPLTANTPVCFAVAGADGLPGGAKAVTGNVTVADPSAAWALYLGPLSTNSPTTSTLNFGAGEVASNNVTVALDGSGRLCATFIGPKGATTELVFDATGYFTDDASGASFVPIDPARVLDTRNGTGSGGKIHANTPRTFAVGGTGSIPSSATVVTGNLTVTDETAGWAIYVGPSPLASPTTSSLNFVIGDVKANGVTIALSSSGTLSATYISNTTANTTSLVFDVTGYFLP
jgi:hypothetical protein